ncbi:MAG: radical SAM protein, partial [Actinomycetaceae bacterium]|nr:radical SAM protein [Actinomycetaceae bacterium]
MCAELADLIELPTRAPEPEKVFSAYVHVPFCQSRCGYCDFNTYTQLDFPHGVSLERYAETLTQEIESSALVFEGADGYLPRVNTVFFGGGTPSMLDSFGISLIYETLEDTFGLVEGAEITIEANPETVTHTYIEDLARAGITRISFGMQSAVPSVLATLDRAHTPGQVRKAVGWAQDAGLETSVDLIYGTPG